MRANSNSLNYVFLCLVAINLFNGCTGMNLGRKQASPVEICTVEDPSAETPCETQVSYTIIVSENVTGLIQLETSFIVRTLDPKSKYTVEIAPDTHEIIRNALEILPSGESSGITEYSIAVKDSQYLDFDGHNGFWWKTIWGDIVSESHYFNITVTEVDTGATATAEITILVRDVNDIAPAFQGVDPNTNEFHFLVCENLEVGTLLPVIEIADLENPLCPNFTDGRNVQATARDANITFEFGSVRLRWAADSKTPPLTMEGDGYMKVNSEVNFDFETSREETYILEAYDNPTEPNNQLVTRIPVRFTILDKADSVFD